MIEKKEVVVEIEREEVLDEFERLCGVGWVDWFETIVVRELVVGSDELVEWMGVERAFD